MPGPAATCPFCSAPVGATKKFCPKCGAILPYAVRAAASESTRGNEIPATRPVAAIPQTAMREAVPWPAESPRADAAAGGPQAVLGPNALASPGGLLADEGSAGVLPKDPMIAVALELVPGLLVSTFGIGNLYVGNIAAGLILMFGYWIATLVNFLLCFVSIYLGATTWTLSFLVAAALGSIGAYGKARRSLGR